MNLPTELLDYVIHKFDIYKDYLKFRSSSASIRNKLVDMERGSPILRKFLVPMIIDQYMALEEDEERQNSFSRSTPFVHEVTSVIEQAKSFKLNKVRYMKFKQSDPFIKHVLTNAEEKRLSFTFPLSGHMNELVFRLNFGNEESYSNYEVDGTATVILGTMLDEVKIEAVNKRTRVTYIVEGYIDDKATPQGEWSLWYKFRNQEQQLRRESYYEDGVIVDENLFRV